MSTISDPRSSSASSSCSSHSSTPTPTPSTSSSSSHNNLSARPSQNANTSAPSVPAATASSSGPSLSSAPSPAPTPLTPVHPSFTLMTPTPPPSSSRPLPESPSDNKHNRKWRASPLTSELTNVGNQHRAQEQSSHTETQENTINTTTKLSPSATVTSTTGASDIPIATAAVTAACSTNTPNPLQTSNVYINGLPPHFKAEQLYALTAQFGTVLSCRTFTRQLAECPSGYGFVLFDTVAAAQQCIDVLRSHHNLHPTFAKQAHKITRTAMMGSLAPSTTNTVTTASIPGLNMNSTNNNAHNLSSSSSVPSSAKTASSLGNNTMYSTSNSNSNGSAYIPGTQSTSPAAMALAGVGGGAAHVEDDGEDVEGGDIYIEGLPPTLTASTLCALLAPHVPRAHRFFADTRRHAADSDGVTATGPPDGVKGGGRTGRLVVFVRLASRAAAQDIRAKLHGRAIRGYSARLGVSFADDLNAEREREVELSPDQEPESGPGAEYGFGFEGGGVSVHGPDDGGRFDAYGDVTGNGGAYSDANVYHAANLYGYTDAEATVTSTTGGAKTNANVNVNAKTYPNANTIATQKMNQQPIMSGLPGSASEGYYDPFYEGFEGDGNTFAQNGFGCGLGNEIGEWNGNFGACMAGSLGYGQRQPLNQGLGLGMGNGPGLGTVEQVQQLLQVRNQLQLQNQLLNATAPISRYSDRLDTETLNPRSRARQYTDPSTPSLHAHNPSSPLSIGGMHVNPNSSLNTLSLHSPLQPISAQHTSLSPGSNTSTLLTHAIPTPLQPISATLHELQLQLESLRPLLAAYSQGGGVMQGQGTSVGSELGSRGVGGMISASAMNAGIISSGYASLSPTATPGTLNANAHATLTPHVLRPRSLTTAHAPTYSAGSGSIIGDTGAGLSNMGTTLNPRAQIYAHPHANGGRANSANAHTGSDACSTGNPNSNNSSSNSANSSANSALSSINSAKHTVTSATLTSANAANTHAASASPTSNRESVLSPGSQSHSRSPAPAPSLAPTPVPGAHARAQTSTEPTPSVRSRAHTTAGHGLGHGLETLALGGPGGTGLTGLGMGLGAPLFPHPHAQSQTQRNGG